MEASMAVTGRGSAGIPDGTSGLERRRQVHGCAGDRWVSATELCTYCHEGGLYPEQVERWRQAAQVANQKPVLALKEHKVL
jgi:transposase